MGISGMAWDGRKGRRKRSTVSDWSAPPEKLPPVSDQDKDKWRKTLTHKDLEVLRDIKRVFPESELIQITFEG